MKKTFLTAMAAVMLTACSEDEMMTLRQDAITFDNAFVDNATRSYDGSYKTNNLTEFQVWGTIINANNQMANIFNGEKVSKTAFTGDAGTGITWKYDATNTQYWIPGNSYKFWAIAEGNVKENGDSITSVYAPEIGKNEPTHINLYDASKQKDILLATAEKSNYQTGDGNNTQVNFTFQHLLAKAKFTVKNTITTNNGYSYKVSNIQITNADKNAFYKISSNTNKKWTFDSDTNNRNTYSLGFGNAVDADCSTQNVGAVDIAYNSSKVSNYERLLIPNTKQLAISFKCQLYKDGILIDTQDARTITTTQAVTMQAGKAYNFIISLGNPGAPITFDVKEVKSWDENHNGYTSGVDMN